MKVISSVGQRKKGDTKAARVPEPNEQMALGSNLVKSVTTSLLEQRRTSAKWRELLHHPPATPTIHLFWCSQSAETTIKDDWSTCKVGSAPYVTTRPTCKRLLSAEGKRRSRDTGISP